MVTASGDIDLDTSPLLVQQIMGLLDRPGVVELRMADVGFVDSIGVRALLRLHEAAVAARSTLVLVRPSPYVTRVLGVLGLADTFHVDVEPTT